MFNDNLSLLQNFLTFLGYTSILWSFSGWAVLLLLVATLPATLSETHFSSNAFRLRNFRSPDSRKLNYLEYVLATDSYAKEVKLFGLGNYLLDRYKALTKQFFLEDKALAIQRAAWALLLSLLAVAAFYGCYYTLAKQSAMGQITLGLLTLYIVSLRQGQQTFQACLTSIGSMYEHNLYLSNLFEFLKESESSNPESPKISPSIKEEKGIRLEEISFKYPEANHFSLENINLFLPAGQSLGIVGHNGAGKTTLFKILFRLYLPTSGRILLDGVNLNDWESEKLYERFGVVFQDFNKYQFSLAENIGFGDLSKAQEKTRILKAAEEGGATSFLSSLPEGLDTQLGKWFAKGVELSQGEWQRVALARAFMREKADILVLDEPTSAFDPMAEEMLLKQLEKLSIGKTLILISHRFPTVRLANKIILLEKGKIKEEGTHAALLEMKGTYHQMFSVQALGYL